MRLQAQNLSYTYADRSEPALVIDDLELRAGVTAVVGVNGAGKSTLLKVLARVIHSKTGAVELDGANITRVEAARRVGYMPQDFALPYRTRVLDGLRYLAWLKGVPEPDATQRCEKLLEQLGLTDRRHDFVASLSGGMVRRLALAQALLTEPDLLLLDEPTTGLDAEQRVVVRDLVRNALPRSTVTVICSHLMEDVANLADWVVLLEAGSVLYSGSLAGFCATPDGSVESAEAAFLGRLARARG